MALALIFLVAASYPPFTNKKPSYLSRQPGLFLKTRGFSSPPCDRFDFLSTIQSYINKLVSQEVSYGLPPVIVPSFKLEWGSSQTRDGLRKGKRKSWIPKFLELATRGTYQGIREKCRYGLHRGSFPGLDKFSVIAVTFYWWYVHVASAFPLAHHYRAMLTPEASGTLNQHGISVAFS
jgi:hypothetical protein